MGVWQVQFEMPSIFCSSLWLMHSQHEWHRSTRWRQSEHTFHSFSFFFFAFSRNRRMRYTFCCSCQSLVHFIFFFFFEFILFTTVSHSSESVWYFSSRSLILSFIVGWLLFLFIVHIAQRLIFSLLSETSSLKCIYRVGKLTFALCDGSKHEILHSNRKSI